MSEKSAWNRSYRIFVPCKALFRRLTGRKSRKSKAAGDEKAVIDDHERVFRHTLDAMAPFDLIMCFDQASFEMHVWETLTKYKDGIK